MAIDATFAGESANSYVTETEWEAYVALHPYYSSLVLSDAELYLPYATMLLDTLVTWKGDRATTTQALEFPRVAPNSDGTSIPSVIKKAQCELVIYLANNAALTTSEDFKVIELGEMRIEPNINKVQTMLPPLVEAMISAWGSVKATGKSSMSTVRVTRG